MPRGGRNRKPAQLKVLAGTLRPGREARRGGGRGRVGLKPPLWLKAIARAKWEEMAPKFTRRGSLDAIAADLLANYCVHWEVTVRCYHRISRDGAVVKGVRGHKTKHPALQVLRDNSEVMRRCLDQLARLGADEPGSREEREDEAFFLEGAGR